MGQNAANGLLLYYAKLFKSVYLGCGVETGAVWDDRDDAKFSELIWGGDVFVAIDTVVGPVYLVYAVAEDPGTSRLRFSLGKTF